MKIASITILAIALLVPRSVLSQQRAQSIRSIDFTNFTYPRIDELKEFIRRKTFSLKAGEYSERGFEDGVHFGDVVYGDVTGDGIEEAIVILGIQTGGSAIPNCVYIYTFKKGRPELLGGFVTGDRADGGLRRIYAEQGELVIELYGKGTRIGGKLDDTEMAAACCAKSVTRTHYQWRNGGFRQKG